MPPASRDTQLSANYVVGRLIGVNLDGRRFVDGGDPSEAFVAAAEHNYEPQPGSVLIGHADPAWAPPLDFRGVARESPFDVGAYKPPGSTR